MAQYISKSDIVAEIERLKSIQLSIFSKGETEESCYKSLSCISVYNEVLSLLDTLEVKENNNVWHDARKTIPEDGSEQIICIKEDGLAVSTVGKIVNGTIKWAYLGDLLDTNSFNVDVKKINNVWNDASDFPKAEAGRSILFIEDNGYIGLLKSPSAERLFYFRTTNLKMWAYVDELLSITTYSEVKETDLEKEAENFVQTKEFVESKESPVLLIAKHFYELGLKTQKGE